ncbi:tetratricopeptide repeat protein [Methyloceanibacter sp.]|uniref:tetratricopeptide repeat protein n=1 Tax=Methyloceanibacter sp. TaxID=1965321 RepID=UPI003D6D31F2
MARSIGYMTALGAGAILLVLALAVPQAFAVEDTDDSGGAKASKGCPSGQRYSEKKHGCVRTSCGTGQVWSSGVDACLDGNSASLSDDDLYVAGRELGQEGHYAEALKLFFRVKNREQARVLNSIGYSTRKLGDVDKGIDYYHQALAIDPNFTKARQYLGEAYLLKGDVAKAKEQLMEIADRCGGPCNDYELLVKAIATYVTEGESADW